MEYETKETLKKVACGVAIVGMGLAGFGLGGMIVEPEVKVITHNVTLPAEKEFVMVEVPVVNETIKEVVVEDDTKIKYLEQKFIDMGIVDEDFSPMDVFMAEDVAMETAIQCAMDDMADFMDDEGMIKDEDKFDIIAVYDDYEDVEIVKSDFEDEKYKFVIKFKVEDEKKEQKFKVLATVLVEDGEPELKSVEKM